MLRSVLLIKCIAKLSSIRISRATLRGSTIRKRAAQERLGQVDQFFTFHYFYIVEKSFQLIKILPHAGVELHSTNNRLIVILKNVIFFYFRL